MTASFHKPLNWYARVLRSSGLAVTSLEEPESTAEFMEKEEDASGSLELPLHFVF